MSIQATLSSSQMKRMVRGSGRAPERRRALRRQHVRLVHHVQRERHRGWDLRAVLLEERPQRALRGRGRAHHAGQRELDQVAARGHRLVGHGAVAHARARVERRRRHAERREPGHEVHARRVADVRARAGGLDRVGVRGDADLHICKLRSRSGGRSVGRGFLAHLELLVGDGGDERHREQYKAICTHFCGATGAQAAAQRRTWHLDGRARWRVFARRGGRSAADTFHAGRASQRAPRTL